MQTGPVNGLAIGFQSPLVSTQDDLAASSKAAVLTNAVNAIGPTSQDVQDVNLLFSHGVGSYADQSA